LLRIGVVLLFFIIFDLISLKLNKLPKILLSLGKNSLWIYIIHLVIVYGSPTSVGLYQIVGKVLSAKSTIAITILMLILMTIISLGIDKFRLTKYNIFRQKI
jgi:fucose 4-O-acetylase-like acetyltransferase